MLSNDPVQSRTSATLIWKAVATAGVSARRVNRAAIAGNCPAWAMAKINPRADQDVGTQRGQKHRTDGDRERSGPRGPEQPSCRDLSDRRHGVQSFMVRRIIDDRANVRRL